MNTKRILLVIVAIISLQTIFSQSSKVSTASILMSDYKLDKNVKDLYKAKEVIDEAIKHETTSVQGKTWYYRGLVYNLLAVDKIAKEDGADYLTIAINSFKKALKINDKKFRNKNEAIEKLKVIAVNSFNEGVESFKTGDFESSYANFTSTKKINSIVKKHGGKESVKTDVAVEYAAISASNAGMLDEAIAGFEKMIAFENGTNYYLRLAKLYQKAGKQEKFEETLEAGSKAFPEDANIIIEQLNLLIKANKVSEAMDKIDKAIELQPENDMLYFVKGNTLENAGKTEKAIELYKKASQINPSNDKALYNIGAVYFKQANEIIKQMNALTTSSSDTKKYNELNEERKNIYRKAKPYFEKTIALKPNDAASKKALYKINSTLEE